MATEKRAYDPVKDEFVDVAVLEPPKKEAEAKDPEEEEEEEEEVTDKLKEAPDDDQEEEEEQEEVVDKSKAEPEKKEEEKEEETADFDSVITKEFEEIGFKSKQDIIDIVDEAKELLTEVETLREENKTLKEKPAESPFKSENQKKIFEALKDYDPDKIPDGLSMLASLVRIDLGTSDTKLILEQEYIMQHPELSLDRARKKFEKRFEDKFSIKDEADLSSAELKEKKEDLEDDLKIERAKSVKFLKEKQEEFKLKSVEDKKVEEPKVSKDVENGIAHATREYAKHVDGTDTLIWKLGEDSKEKFSYKFSKEQLTKINNLVNNHLKSPSAYNPKGELIGGFDPEEKFQQAAHIVCGPEMVTEALKFAGTYAQVLKAEDIGKKKPSRVAKTSGDVKTMDIDSQLDRLAAQKKAERGGR